MSVCAGQVGPLSKGPDTPGSEAGEGAGEGREEMGDKTEEQRRQEESKRIQTGDE